ncbi:MAG TPA: hypothetical protein VFF73_35800 [Planctomycetota bacterium]|nr:hypothetical protein [Planctomycetota bacterium]
MSDAPDEVQELVSIATLGEGLLREPDEHRILKVLLTAGFSPLEARERIDAALAALGARRAAPTDAPPVDTSGGRSQMGATPSALARAITRSFKRKERRKVSQPSSDEAVLAELVSPAPIGPEEPPGVCSACLAAIPGDDVRAGRAEVYDNGSRHCRACLSKLRAGLICKVCYKPINRAELLDGRSQLHGDRAVHVPCLPQVP